VSLTPKQQAFVDAYLVEPNATKAAIAAGYSKKTAYSAGGRLLKNVEVSAALNKRVSKVAEKAEVTAEEVLRGLKLEANGAGEDTNSSSRVTAWGLLGKHLKLFTDKTELSGADGGPLKVAFNINLGEPE
jgi:phage terminase small subunit